MGPLPSGNRTLQGRTAASNYELADGAQPPTGIAVQHSVLAALKAIGATIVSAEDNEDLVAASQTTPAGETWYIYTAGGGNSDARTSFTLGTLVVGALAQDV